MNKFVLLIMMLGVGYSSYTQIVNIPDPVFKSALINVGVDTNNDGEIQVSEAEAVTSLNVWQNVIESLEGIEYFINLTSLDCSANLLTELDVSALVNLEFLDCSSNDLETINVEGLTQLTRLWTPFNQLTTIDISSLQNLEWIYCSGNQLNALDVSGLINLGAIWASRNNIPTIDFTDLHLLRSIHLDDNLLSTVDVSFLQNLEILRISNNFLTEIDISNMPSLGEIYIGYNDIAELDCSTTGAYMIHCENNPNLTSVNVQNGVISYSDPDLLNWGFYFFNLPALEFVCMDPDEQQALSHSGYNPSSVTIATGPNCTLGIEDISSNDFSVYPIPVTNVLFIEKNHTIVTLSIKIYDVFGKQALVANGNLNQIDLSEINSGVYFIEIVTDLGVVIKKIIKE